MFADFFYSCSILSTRSCASFCILEVEASASALAFLAAFNPSSFNFNSRQILAKVPG